MAKSILTIWVFAELLVYILFLSHFPVLSALLIGIVSTALGGLTLRLIGQRLTANATKDVFAAFSSDDLRSAPLALLGAILLVLPGFLTDALGLLLVLVGVRTLLQAPPAGGGTDREIDLARDQWTRLPDDEKPK